MTVFVLALTLLCFGFAHWYTPPSPSYRMFPDLSPATATIATIVSMNLMIWLAWRWTPLWPFLTQNFMHNPAFPRAHQAITNVFTHVTHEHLVANMAVLILVGPLAHSLLDRGVFVGTYLSAGAIGTLASLYWANLGRGNILAHSVGASAAIYGVVALYLALTDKDRIHIPFVKDMSTSFWPKSLLAAIVAVEVFNASRGKAVADHASHFGGILTGLSVAGFMHYRGFHSGHMKKAFGAGEVPEKAGVDDKTLDIGAVVAKELKEVKEEIKKVVK
jgi:rhomboid-like protein